MDPRVFLEMSDVVRETGYGTATIRERVLTGRLPVAARTRRGVRLFDPKDVEALRRERERRRSAGTA